MNFHLKKVKNGYFQVEGSFGKQVINSSELKELIEKCVKNYGSYYDKVKTLVDIYHNYTGTYGVRYCNIDHEYRDYPILKFNHPVLSAFVFFKIGDDD